ncbi:MAG TPA: hypothetical protein VHW44_11770 [Pseudonocardiaceae bacterium]|nr:hypothetical protein [Pseudonocardiaceae bacterium]
MGTSQHRALWIGAVALVVVAGVGTTVALAATGQPTTTRTVAATSSLSQPDPVVPPVSTPIAVAPTTVVPPVATTTAPKAPTTTHQAPDPKTVPGCEKGCQVAFSTVLPGDGRLEGLVASLDSTGGETGILAYWVSGRLVSHQVETGGDSTIGDLPQQAVCQGTGSTQHCIVSFEAGAHGGVARLLTLSPHTGVTVTDLVSGDDADTELVDLNHDGVTDAVMRLSTYEPDYATAPQAWQTVLVHNGRFDAPTGCTVPVPGAGPAPTSPVTGNCPS